MNIYVQTAGISIEHGYTWKKSVQSSLPDELNKWHANHLSELDTSFALIAGRFRDSWSIEFRNLLLPGVYDPRNRQIVINICFTGLQSEREVRAMALAYLDMELRYRDDSRCLGRYCDALFQAYKTTSDGGYDYDFKAAADWAEKVIGTYGSDLKDSPLQAKVVCSTNAKDVATIDKLRSVIRSQALRADNGVRLLWASCYADTQLPADIIVTGSKDSSTWKNVPLNVTHQRQEEKTRGVFCLSHTQKAFIIGAVTVGILLLGVALAIQYNKDTAKKCDVSVSSPAILTQPKPTDKQTEQKTKELPQKTNEMQNTEVKTLKVTPPDCEASDIAENK